MRHVALACGHHQSTGRKLSNINGRQVQFLPLSIAIATTTLTTTIRKCFSLVWLINLRVPPCLPHFLYSTHAVCRSLSPGFFPLAIVLCLLLGHFCYGFVSKLWPLPFLLPLSNKLNPHMLWASVCTSVCVCVSLCLLVCYGLLMRFLSAFFLLPTSLCRPPKQIDVSRV